MEGEKGRVCVTGGSGFIGSWLVMRFLDHGYSVNTTVRSSDPENKKDLSFLTSLPGASERLKIFSADLNNPESFNEAIEGCIGVFHVATPVDFEDREPEQVVTKRSIDGALGILKACLDAKTVKRVVYTSSASAVAFGNHDLENVDESFWSDVDYIKAAVEYGGSYMISKTLTEKAVLEFSEKYGLDVVTVIPSFVVGPFICPKLPGSVHITLALVFGLLHEMLGSTRTENSKSWKVLIMDKVTVKVMSHSCKMADITDQEISLVEDLFRRREPLPSMDVIYFMQPSKENVVMFLSDMSGREPLYRKAFIFFSSPIPKELVNHIKSDTSVLPRIGALREMNLEYFPIDSQAFITDQERALEELFGDFENVRKFDACLNVTASRIATVFASLKELPFVRYRAAKSLDDPTEAKPRDLVPTKLAAAVWDIISKYKSSIPNFPQKESCELLILDRSVDQIAPVIHEWTYDAMCHDLLDMDGNKYMHEVPSKTGGDPEKKEVLLEENDPVWLELRHSHIADASERLHDKFTTFQSKNKAAQLQQSAREGNELSTRDLHKMVQALPQYTEQVEKISLHVEIAGTINKIIKDTGLRDLGQLEQDLVFGDAGAKDVINFLRTSQDTTPENKLRLLMIYASVYPEKFEGDKATKLMQLAKLSHDDMKVVNNMRLLGGSTESKKGSSGFSLKFNAAKTKQAARKDRTGEEETWQLFRFYPVLEELLENLNKGELPNNEYPCINGPPAAPQGGSLRGRSSTSQTSQSTTAPHSMRSRRTANWGRAGHSDDGYSSDSVLRGASTDFKKMGQRIFVFVVGGATRSELRVCHKMTTKLRREVIMGTTGLIEPPQYITKLKLLSENK